MSWLCAWAACASWAFQASGGCGAAEEIAWTLRIPPDHIVTCANYIAVTVDAAQQALNRRVPVTAVPNAIEVDRFSRTTRAGARAAGRMGQAGEQLRLEAAREHGRAVEGRALAIEVPLVR